MPYAAKKPCAANGCAEVVERGNRWCAKHEQELSGWAQLQRRTGNTTQRGYGHAWRKLRSRVLRRDMHLCQECRRNNKLVTGTEVDHIVRKADGGTDDMDNLQTLCKPWHAAKTATEGGGASAKG